MGVGHRLGARVILWQVPLRLGLLVGHIDWLPPVGPWPGRDQRCPWPGIGIKPMARELMLQLSQTSQGNIIHFSSLDFSHFLTKNFHHADQLSRSKLFCGGKNLSVLWRNKDLNMITVQHTYCYDGRKVFFRPRCIGEGAAEVAWECPRRPSRAVLQWQKTVLKHQPFGFHIAIPESSLLWEPKCLQILSAVSKNAESHDPKFTPFLRCQFCLKAVGFCSNLRTWVPHRKFQKYWKMRGKKKNLVSVLVHRGFPLWLNIKMVLGAIF